MSPAEYAEGRLPLWEAIPRLRTFGARVFAAARSAAASGWSGGSVAAGLWIPSLSAACLFLYNGRCWTRLGTQFCLKPPSTGSRADSAASLQQEAAARRASEAPAPAEMRNVVLLYPWDFPAASECCSLLLIHADTGQFVHPLQQQQKISGCQREAGCASCDDASPGAGLGVYVHLRKWGVKVRSAPAAAAALPALSVSADVLKSLEGDAAVAAAALAVPKRQEGAAAAAAAAAKLPCSYCCSAVKRLPWVAVRQQLHGPSEEQEDVLSREPGTSSNSDEESSRFPARKRRLLPLNERNKESGGSNTIPVFSCPADGSALEAVLSLPFGEASCSSAAAGKAKEEERLALGEALCLSPRNKRSPSTAAAAASGELLLAVQSARSCNLLQCTEAFRLDTAP
ncbi:hypothetical protein cyc_06197 [Cyclospora cayetanensis]|uniref:Uncharacterized protein n=1 Tax=Cyclospora cayetanensis TaxID=88456 RepID=A0A1D3CSU9_9EIME|nr:hypothetical protein cyc_06197 [Cyclospora cayetanensis]